MVSALKANRSTDLWSEAMQHYYEAKAAADDYLRESDLYYTILMPGRLTNKNGTGNVELKKKIEEIEERTVSRDDVASVITEIIDTPSTFGKCLDLLQGDETIEEAIKALDTA